MTDSKKTKISLILNILIVISTLIALVFVMFDKQEGDLGGFKAFKSFTLQSNIFRQKIRLKKGGFPLP